MIVLTEQIEIPASYEKLKAWTANFEEEFVKWSPYHIECKKHLPMPVFGIGRCSFYFCQSTFLSSSCTVQAPAAETAHLPQAVPRSALFRGRSHRE